MKGIGAASQPLRVLASSLLQLFFPWRCIICSAVLPADTLWHYVCQECFNEFEPAPPPHELLATIEQMGNPDDCALSQVMARWSARSTDQAGLFTLIHALKYYGYWRIGLELGVELGAAVRLLSTANYDAIIPVPIHPARRRERGYNQAEAIADGVASVLHLPIWHDALRRIRYTQSQTTLSAAERRENTRGAFGAGKQSTLLRGATILIVDDVFTTGSTLNSVAIAALALGAARVDAATIVVATS